MEYTIKRAKPGDEETLAFIQTESWKAAFGGFLDAEYLERCTRIDKATTMYRDLLERKVGSGYLLRVEGEPHCIAWWDAARQPDMPGYAELICLHSLPGRWRRGYGSIMMQTVLRDMAAAGYERVMLWVFADNARARRFYEAHGFETQGRTLPGSAPAEISYERAL